MLSLFLLVYAPWAVKLCWKVGHLQISIIIINIIIICWLKSADIYIPEKKNQQLMNTLAVILFDWF